MPCSTPCFSITIETYAHVNVSVLHYTKTLYRRHLRHYTKRVSLDELWLVEDHWQHIGCAQVYCMSPLWQPGMPHSTFFAAHAFFCFPLLSCACWVLLRKGIMITQHRVLTIGHLVVHNRLALDLVVATYLPSTQRFLRLLCSCLCVPCYIGIPFTIIYA